MHVEFLFVCPVTPLPHLFVQVFWDYVLLLFYPSIEFFLFPPSE